MRVNVVIHWDERKTKGRKRGAIHRMAGYLRRIEGWTVTGKLDAAANVNYVFGYADRWKSEANPWQKYCNWPGRLAGYFTHREPVGIKHRLWDQAAETVDLRITESRKYARLLAPYGPTEQATIPVERDMFTLKGRLKNDRPTIGVSGYCPISGRKGNMLVYELARYPLADSWRIVAAGRGWPVPTVMYKWQDLPRFYQGLDVYLCSSLCEGGPLGVFEALSCGIPVVIPRGVGALDELPSVRGIYHYHVGDFDEMCDCLWRCIHDWCLHNWGTNDRQALRDLTSGMTPEKFCEDHQRIFEKHFEGGNRDPAS